MKKKIWLLSALAAASVLACAVGFASCDGGKNNGGNDSGDGGNTPTHSHTWATEYSKNGVSHWFACSGCDEKKDATPHDFSGGSCVCGVTASVGLLPEANADGDSVCIKSMGDCTDSDIIIPPTLGGKPVTSIAANVFSGNTSLKSIALPASVTNVGARAFSECTSLVSVSVAESPATLAAYALPFADTQTPTEIGAGAFEGCTSLVSMEIPCGVTTIDYCAFRECTSLTDVTIPNSVTEIGMFAFESCTSLKRISLPAGVTGFFEAAPFIFCTSLERIDVAENNASCSSLNGVLYNKDKTKLYCYPAGIQATAFSISNTVTYIGPYAFYGCTATSITLPKSLTYINAAAFAGCPSLTSITVPDSVTTIEDMAFGECPALTNITVGSNNQNYTSRDGILYDKTLTTLICTPAGIQKTSLSIPDGVTKIEYHAFEGCTVLTKVIIPDSVTKIEYQAFSGCTALTDITFEGTRAQWEAIEKGSSWNENTGDYTVHCSDDE